MAYTPQTWTNGSAGGTPLSAARLTHMENGIEDADTRVTAVESDVQAITDRLDDAPGLYNSLWAGGGSETLSRLNLTNIAGTSGRITFTYVTAPVTVTINTLTMVANDPAASSQTLARMAIFEVDGSNDLTKIAQTASDTTFLNSTFTDDSMTLDTTGGFPSSIMLEQGTRYAFAYLSVASTSPTVRGAIADVAFREPYVCKIVNGASDIDDTYADGALTGWFEPLFIAGVFF